MTDMPDIMVFAYEVGQTVTWTIPSIPEEQITDPTAFVGVITELFEFYRGQVGPCYMVEFTNEDETTTKRVCLERDLSL